MRKFIPALPLIAATFLLPSLSFAANISNDFDAKRVENILKMPHRKVEDRARDTDREPVAAMKFWGIKPNMKVIEFGPGGGWYTKILAPYLEKEGELFLVSNTEWLDNLNPILKEQGMSKAKKQAIDIGWNNETNGYAINTDSFGLSNIDMVLNIREYHGFFADGKKRLNKAAFDALKPGGKYVLIDHTRRHMQPEDAELGRREDPVKVILEVQAAGFVLDSASDLFFRPDDELRYEVGRKTVSGNTVNGAALLAA